MKKIYKNPKIKAVELDADQAILQVCSVDGEYMAGPTTCILTSGGTRAGMCLFTVRGQAVTGNPFGTLNTPQS